MPTQKQIIAEIKTALKSYDQQGMLDDIFLKNWIKENIKEFGGNIMNEYQKVLIVEKGKVKLPDNFWALKMAIKCEQEGYTKEKGESHKQSSFSYIEHTKITDYYNYLQGRPCEEDCDTKYITETLYFKEPNQSYKFYYKSPKLLNLKNHVYTVRCDKDCPNFNNNSPFEISIDENHNYLYTNFNKGFIWLHYKGLPIDENGDLFIPDTSRDKLKNYIFYNCIVRSLEMILLSEEDAGGVYQKLNVFKPRADEYYYAAKAESIDKGIVGWQDRIINNNRKEMSKYESMFRNL